MRIILIILLISSSTCYSNDRDRAIRHIRRAIMQQETVVKYRRNASKAVKSMIPKEAKPYIATFGSIGMAVVRGRIESRRLGNINFDTMGGTIRPNIEYNFRENTFNTNIMYEVDF